MTAARRLRGACSLALALLVPVGCSTLSESARGRGGSPFVARQYLERGRAAWAAGNEANAKFLIGRAVELDPSSEEALAQWRAHWPVDSLPPEARSARDALATGAQAEEVAASYDQATASDERTAAPDEQADSPDEQVAAPDERTAASSEPAAAPDEPVPRSAEAPPAAAGAPAGSVAPPDPATAVPGRVSARDALAGLSDLPDDSARRASRTPAAAPDPELPPDEVAALRSRFEAVRSGGGRAALGDAGEELLRARPHYLPDLYRVLSAWVDYRLDPAGTEARVRDVLGSLEFGDPAYLAGKPEDAEEGPYLRAWRGRFLDLLGWSAFVRGDMSQAEAALLSAETEINLRGRGDVAHLRHLASFYERRGDLGKAERYAVAAAARDESGSGEVRALASRLWVRRHKDRAGLESRLAAEAERVRKEERSAATSGRLYDPLPVFMARRADGQPAIGDQSLRGRVTIVVLWDPGCEDCSRLLRDLSARGLALPARDRSGGGSGHGAPVEILALVVGGAADAAERAGVRALTGVIEAAPERPRALLNALSAARLPLTLVVEPVGFVQYRHTGYPAETRARERWLERLGWQVESLRSLRDPAPSAKR